MERCSSTKEAGHFTKKVCRFAVQIVEQLKKAANAARDEAARLQVLILFGAVGLMTFLGPFGTGHDFSVMTRFVYWSVSIWTGFVGGLAYGRLGYSSMARRLGHLPAKSLEIVAIILSALAAVLVLEAIFRQPVPVRYILPLLGSVGVLALAIWGVVLLGFREAPKPVGEETDPAFEAFRETWPQEIRGATLLAFSAEDHYIRLYTASGTGLVSGRFGDALEAVRSLAGARVHRSWWVADQAVYALRRNGGLWRIAIQDGPEVPVSRRFRPTVRSMGWIDRTE